jgi:tetratricopeptide (TPR) repeat protein
VGELSRLVRLARAYEHLNEGDAHVTRNDLERALASYGEATTLVPDRATNGEAAFWTGVTLAGAGRVDEGLGYLVRAYRSDSRWAVLLRRLPAAGLLPADSSLIKRLVRGMGGGN